MHIKFNKDGKFFKRLAIVLGILTIVTLALILLAYLTRARVRYTLQKVDCSQAAIEARNKTEGSSSKGCVIIVNATNLKDASEFVDWEGVGGGPGAGWHPMIKINTSTGTFCYADTAPDPDSLDDLKPHESRNLSLRCVDPGQKMPQSYDAHSDEHPSSIIIDDWSDVILPVPSSAIEKN